MKEWIVTEEETILWEHPKLFITKKEAQDWATLNKPKEGYKFCLYKIEYIKDLT